MLSVLLAGQWLGGAVKMMCKSVCVATGNNSEGAGQLVEPLKEAGDHIIKECIAAKHKNAIHVGKVCHSEKSVSFKNMTQTNTT